MSITDSYIILKFSRTIPVNVSERRQGTERTRDLKSVERKDPRVPPTESGCRVGGVTSPAK